MTTNTEPTTESVLNNLVKTAERCVRVPGAVPIDRKREAEAIRDAKAALETIMQQYAEAVIGEDIEHKHLTRVYDKGCQDRDVINSHLRKQRGRNNQLKGKL